VLEKVDHADSEAARRGQQKDLEQHGGSPSREFTSAVDFLGLHFAVS
jgi:hypothetical protein